MGTDVSDEWARKKAQEEWARDVVLRSSGLRGQGRYDDSIKNILDNVDKIDDETAKMGAYRELLVAAEAKGDDNLARVAAGQLSKIDPNLPSIQKYVR